MVKKCKYKKYSVLHFPIYTLNQQMLIQLMEANNNMKKKQSNLKIKQHGFKCRIGRLEFQCRKLHLNVLKKVLKPTRIQLYLPQHINQDTFGVFWMKILSNELIKWLTKKIQEEMNPKIDKWCERLEWIDAQGLGARHLPISNNPELSPNNEFHKQIIPSLENAKIKIKKIRQQQKKKRLLRPR